MGTALEKYGNKSREDLIRELEELKGSIAQLGDGAVFVRKDAQGLVRSVRQNVTLSADAGDIQYIARTPDGKERYMVTVGGVAKLNRVPGLNAIFPKEIVIDGVAQSNPYSITDPKTHVLRGVHVRVIVLGPNPLGNMCAVDYSLYFNLHTYLMQDLQSAIKKYPSCGMLGTEDQRPSEFVYNEPKWETYKYRGETRRKMVPGDEVTLDVSRKPLKFIEIGDGVGLWVDLSHPEIKAAFNSHVQRQKFGDRQAQSICVRNAMLLHPAIAAKNVTVQNKRAVVPVFAWRHELDPRKISELVDKVERGAVEELEAEGMVVEMAKASAEASYEEVTLAPEADELGSMPEEEPVSNEDAEEVTGDGILDEGATAPAAGEPPAPPPEGSEALRRVLEYKGILGEKDFRAALKKAKIYREDSLKGMSETELLNIERTVLRPAVDQ